MSDTESGLDRPQGLDRAGERRTVRRALVSVYDKTGLTGLATALHDAGVAIVSTGSTASL